MEPMSPVSDPGYARAAEAPTDWAQLRAELADLRAELANLRDELDQRRRADFEAIVEVVADYSKDALDQVTGWTKRVLAELFDRIDGRFAALQARVDGVLPDTKCTSRFARESDDEVSEPPNPLPPRRVN
jgi:hypothetical protein